MQTETYYAPLINYPTNDNSIDIIFSEFDKEVDEQEDENGNFETIITGKQTGYTITNLDLFSHFIKTLDNKYFLWTDLRYFFVCCLKDKDELSDYFIEGYGLTKKYKEKLWVSGEGLKIWMAFHNIETFHYNYKKHLENFINFDDTEPMFCP
jgi:hypothetical protein